MKIASANHESDNDFHHIGDGGGGGGGGGGRVFRNLCE